MVMKNVKKKIQRIPYLFLLMLFSCLTASAQQGITVKGTVVDDRQWRDYNWSLGSCKRK